MTQAQQRLRELMLLHQLTRAQLAERTGYSVDAVNAWLKPITSKSHRDIPPRALRLIESELSK